jgi:hypothetical protein
MNYFIGGTVPTEIAQLTALTKLCVSFFTSLEAISRFLTCQHRDLSRNDIVGSLPSDIGNMTALESLWDFMLVSVLFLTVSVRSSVEFNLMNGTLPSQLKQLSRLTNLCVPFHTFERC